jgi:hypothetical protein
MEQKWSEESQNETTMEDRMWQKQATSNQTCKKEIQEGVFIIGCLMASDTSWELVGACRPTNATSTDSYVETTTLFSAMKSHS